MSKQNLNEQVNRIKQMMSLNESTEEQQYVDLLSQAGLSLSPEEMMDVSYECPLEDPPAEYSDLVSNISTKLDGMGVSELVSVLKQVKSIKKQQPVVQEQVGAAIIIAGVSVPMVAVVVVAGLVAVIIIVKLARLIFRKDKKKRSSACKRRGKLYRKFGIDGMFM